MKSKTVPRFTRIKEEVEFTKTLHKKVNVYFKDNEIAKTGNAQLWLKVFIGCSLMLVPYIIIVSQIIVAVWLQIGLIGLMGIGIAFTGMNVMHDANHGSFSSKKWINELLGRSMYLFGCSKYNWKIQHNILHHTYTNIHEHDEDIAIKIILRFSKYAPWMRFQQNQHIYAWFLYGLLTLQWIAPADFKRLSRYLKQRRVPADGNQKLNPTKEWIILIGTKIAYLSMYLVLPIVVGYTWWQVLIGFFVMHYIAGFILSVVFQLAHVNDKTPVIQVDNAIPHIREVHQLHTTANFATDNRFLSWCLGGLNFQVEHHLFMHISHVHYPAIAPIVKKTCEEFGKTYYVYDTMWDAILAHKKQLRALGAQV